VAAGAASLASADITDERVLLGGNVGNWTTATRPGGASNPTPPIPFRTLGYNRTSQAWEFYTPTGWANLIPAPVTWATLTGKPTTSTLDGRTITTATTDPSGTATQGDLWVKVL
jgi:hypothetical protein